MLSYKDERTQDYKKAYLFTGHTFLYMHFLLFGAREYRSHLLTHFILFGAREYSGRKTSNKWDSM